MFIKEILRSWELANPFKLKPTRRTMVHYYWRTIDIVDDVQYFPNNIRQEQQQWQWLKEVKKDIFKMLHKTYFTHKKNSLLHFRELTIRCNL